MLEFLSSPFPVFLLTFSLPPSSASAVILGVPGDKTLLVEEAVVGSAEEVIVFEYLDVVSTETVQPTAAVVWMII